MDFEKSILKKIHGSRIREEGCRLTSNNKIGQNEENLKTVVSKLGFKFVKSYDKIEHEGKK